ncbi:hypothetical protein DFH06DRAFT_1147026 [Mycena polygramma]|nr:hypothetical protein DFH06DRAFT_1147026 [Mycena polygramma]
MTLQETLPTTAASITWLLELSVPKMRKIEVCTGSKIVQPSSTQKSTNSTHSPHLEKVSWLVSGGRAKALTKILTLNKPLWQNTAIKYNSTQLYAAQPLRPNSGITISRKHYSGFDMYKLGELSLSLEGQDDSRTTLCIAFRTIELSSRQYSKQLYLLSSHYTDIRRHDRGDPDVWLWRTWSLGRYQEHYLAWLTAQLVDNPTLSLSAILSYSIRVLKQASRRNESKVGEIEKDNIHRSTIVLRQAPGANTLRTTQAPA